VRELSLAFLNEATQAWVEIEYNRRAHREIACSPVQRFSQSPDVLRASPSSVALRDAFRMEGSRTQRQSDGTISVEGVRLEIPARYRHFRKVSVRYARWDLSRVDLVDPRSGTILSPLYPLDRQANADGQRLLFEPDDGCVPATEPRPDEESHDQQLPPLLKRLLAEYSATGLPPAYLPKNPPSRPGETP
jgi:hypothetical protein